MQSNNCIQLAIALEHCPRFFFFRSSNVLTSVACVSFKGMTRFGLEVDATKELMIHDEQATINVEV